MYWIPQITLPKTRPEYPEAAKYYSLDKWRSSLIGHVWFIPPTSPTKRWLTNFLAQESVAPVSPIHGRKSELHVSRTTWVRQYFGVQRPPTKPRPTVVGEPIFW
jgi:hypothetical protein